MEIVTQTDRSDMTESECPGDHELNTGGSGIYCIGASA